MSARKVSSGIVSAAAAAAAEQDAREEGPVEECPVPLPRSPGHPASGGVGEVGRGDSQATACCPGGRGSGVEVRGGGPWEVAGPGLCGGAWRAEIIASINQLIKENTLERFSNND